MRRDFRLKELLRQNLLLYLTLLTVAAVWQLFWTAAWDQWIVRGDNQLLLSFVPREIRYLGWYILVLVSAICSITPDRLTRRFRFWVTVAALVLFTLSELLHHFDYALMDAGHRTLEERVNLVPFGGSLEAMINRFVYPALFPDSWRNFLLFLPLGVLIHTGGRRKGICLALLLAAAVLIEPLQLVSRLGRCDIDDVIYRLVGILLGYGAGRLRVRFCCRTGRQTGF